MRVVLIAFLCFLHSSVCLEPWKGYIVNRSSGIGYKIMYQSQTWPVARDRCKEDGAKLAVPETKEEFLFIQKLVRAMSYPNVTGTDFKLLVWLGINNIDDYRTWVTIDGKKLEDTGFHTWAQGNGEGFSNAVEEPHCVGLDAANFGLRDYWCHRRQPYVCQMNF